MVFTDVGIGSNESWVRLSKLAIVTATVYIAFSLGQFTLNVVIVAKLRQGDAAYAAAYPAVHNVQIALAVLILAAYIAYLIVRRKWFNRTRYVVQRSGGDPDAALRHPLMSLWRYAIFTSIVVNYLMRNYLSADPSTIRETQTQVLICIVSLIPPAVGYLLVAAVLAIRKRVEPMLRQEIALRRQEAQPPQAQEA